MVTRCLIALALLAHLADLASAQTPSPNAPPHAPAPLSTPSMAGPLQLPAPTVFDAGPFGQLDVNGIVSGIGLWQGNSVAGGESARGDLGNGQVFLQKTTGWWQFYVQAGAYNIPVLGVPLLSTGDTVDQLYGPVPVAYLKLVPSQNFSVLVGSLPTLIGTESTFTFQNMNIERGLLWNQENAVNRGVQVNQALGKLNLSLSWNDGFYSDRYSWLTGAATYSIRPAHSISFTAGGNLDQTRFQRFATPVQNNTSIIYDIIYTYNHGPWIVTPYFQSSNVPANARAAIPGGGRTHGGALLVSRGFGHHLFLAARGEYISTAGNAAAQAVNLLFGPGSGGWSLTVTPTYQSQRFFARGEVSWVRALDAVPADAFGSRGNAPNQVRGVLEAGVLF